MLASWLLVSLVLAPIHAPQGETVQSGGGLPPASPECGTLMQSCVQTTLDVTYYATAEAYQTCPHGGPHDERDYNKMNVYMPQFRSVCAPTVIWLHSGGWSTGFSGAQKDEPFNVALCSSLAASGFPVLDCNYYLSCFDPCIETPPGSADPLRTVRDVKRIINWVRTTGQGPAWCLPSEIVIAGSSAGGHLAVMMAATQGPGETTFDPPEVQDYSVQLAIAFSSPFDFISQGCNGTQIPLDAFGMPRCDPLSTCFPTCGGMPSYVRSLPTPRAYPCPGEGVCLGGNFQEVFLGRIWRPDRDPLNITKNGITYLYDCSNYTHFPPMPTGNRWYDYSPLLWIDGTEPPIYVFQAACDGWMSSVQGQELFDRVSVLGGRCTLTTVEPDEELAPACDPGYRHAAEGFSLDGSSLVAAKAANRIRDIILDEWSGW